jgi:hypothetical protein
MKISDKEQFTVNLKALIGLEALGIHVEDVKEKNFDCCIISQFQKNLQ